MLGLKLIPVASFTKEVNLRLAKCPLKTNGRLAIRRLNSLVKEAIGMIEWLSRTGNPENWLILLCMCPVIQQTKQV